MIPFVTLIIRSFQKFANFPGELSFVAHHSPGEVSFLGKPKPIFPFTVVTLIAACLIVYWPVLSHEFQTGWDDQWEVINYYTDRGLASDNLWSVLTEFYNGQYAPVNEYYYIILHSIFGYSPFWFHLGSLLIHICNVLLVYKLFRMLLFHTNEFEEKSVQRIAFLTALFLAVHPLTVEVVAWVAASKNTLYIFFYLVGLICYIQYCSTNKIRYLVLTGLAFIFSFGAKEQAVTFPFCLLLIDFILHRNFFSRKVWFEKIPFFTLSLLFGIVTMLSQADSGEGMLSDEPLYPLYQNVLFGCYSLVEYLTKILVPVKLSYLYPFPNQPGEPVPVRFWVYPIIIALLVLLLWNFWKRRWVFFGMCFFLVHIGLVLHILPLSRFAIIADRYVYLAAVGVFFILSFYIDKFLIRWPDRRNLILSAIFIYVFSLGIYTNFRSRAWHNTDSLKKEIRDLVLEKRNAQEKPRK